MVWDTYGQVLRVEDAKSNLSGNPAVSLHRDACKHIPHDKARSVAYTGPTMAVDSALTIEPIPGNKPGTVILRLTGPIILNNVLPLRAMFRDSEPPRLTILDLSGVSYIDSAGMSEIINHEVYCRGKGVRLTLAGVTPRVLGMLQITRLDTVLTLAASVAEAEAEG
jgi:anti-anti-sigma factor